MSLKERSREESEGGTNLGVDSHHSFLRPLDNSLLDLTLLIDLWIQKTEQSRLGDVDERVGRDLLTFCFGSKDASTKKESEKSSVSRRPSPLTMMARSQLTSSNPSMTLPRLDAGSVEPEMSERWSDDGFASLLLLPHFNGSFVVRGIVRVFFVVYGRW